MNMSFCCAVRSIAGKAGWAIIMTPSPLWLRYCQIYCMQPLPSFYLICSTCKKMGVRSCVPQLFISLSVYLIGASPFAEPNLAPNRRGAQFAKNRLCWTFFGIDSTDQVMWMAHKNTLSMSKGCQQSRSKTMILLFAKKTVDIRLQDDWSEYFSSCQRAARITMLLLLVKKDFDIHFKGTIFWTEWMNCWYDQDKNIHWFRNSWKNPDET